LKENGELPDNPKVFEEMAMGKNDDNGKFMEMFFEKFVRYVRPSTVWRRAGKIASRKLYSPVDEAYAMLVVYNFWEGWVVENPMENKDGERLKENVRKNGKKYKEGKQGKYTDRSKPHLENLSGWTEEGHDEYVRLVAKFVEKRMDEETKEERDEWDERFMAKQRGVVHGQTASETDENATAGDEKKRQTARQVYYKFN